MNEVRSENFPPNYLSPAELVSCVPYLLEYQPEESVVTFGVTLGDTDIVFGPTFPVGRKRFCDPAVGRSLRHDFIATLLGRVQPAGVIVVYSQDVFSHDGEFTAPYLRDLLTELSAWFALGIFVPERTFIVGAKNWRCWRCPTDDHCPPEGQSRQLCKSSHIATRMVVEGRHYAASREELLGIENLQLSQSTYQRAKRELHVVSRRKAGDDQWYSDLQHTWTKALNRVLTHQNRIHEPDLLRMAISLHDVPLRDNVIYAVCCDKPVPDPTLSGEAHFSQMFSAPTPPDFAKVVPLNNLFQQIISICPQVHRAPVLAVWAWVKWWFGAFPRARLLTEMAGEVDPTYSLVETLRCVLDRGNRPPWHSGVAG